MNFKAWLESTEGTMIRLYRAQEKPDYKPTNAVSWLQDHKAVTQVAGRWFTDDPSNAQWYIDNEYPNGIIVYVDIPRETAERFRVSGMTLKTQPGFNTKDIPENPAAFSRQPDKEFFLPKELASAAKPLQ